MAGLMVVLDGIQDITYPQLEGKTPYDFGKGENFIQLEQASTTGTLVTTPLGFEPDTQTCVLTLLGVEPKDIPDGRSYIEALALGISVGDKDIIMRCNFVKLDEAGNLEVPCCNAPDNIAKALREQVAAQNGHSVFPVGSYKSLQLIENGREYLKNFTSYTPHQHQGEKFEDLLPHGNRLADELANFSRCMYQQFKPYTVLNWGQAVKGDLPAFSSLHKGMTGAIISKTDAPMGTAVAMGMACPRLETATGDTDTDLAAKLQATLDLLGKHDFVMLHIGGPDEATHRQNAVEKAAFTTRLDAELMGPLLERAPQGTRIMVNCDHKALCTTAGHTDEPVQFWLYEKGKKLSGDMGEFVGTWAIEILIGQ